jgi:hypothetical protein
MRSLPHAFRAGLAFAVVAGATVLGWAAEEEEPSFRAIRTRDELRLTVGPGILSFNQTIEMTPIGKVGTLPPGRPNLVHVLIPALWVNEGGVGRPAFSNQRPYFQSSQGRVRRFALLKPDGDRVLTADQMTPECRYVLTLEFGHVIPQKFSVVVNFVSTQTLNPAAELHYNPSNDGYPIRSGPTASVVTDLRVKADVGYEEWRVTQGDSELPLVTPSTVQLQREVDHVIRFVRP